MDHMVDQRLFRIGADNPYFVGPIVTAFFLLPVRGTRRGCFLTFCTDANTRAGQRKRGV
jgi:hypothetical protein